MLILIDFMEDFVGCPRVQPEKTFTGREHEARMNTKDWPLHAAPSTTDWFLHPGAAIAVAERNVQDE